MSTRTDAVEPVTVVVLAKAPVAGRVKTRLCPPYTLGQAAELAAAALADTLAAVRATLGTQRPVLALEGRPGRIDAVGFDLLPQRGQGLDERIAAAMTDVHLERGGPVLLVGMDTPQLTPGRLARPVGHLAGGGDAVLGPAADGGFWALGLQRPTAAHVLGVAMSTARTGADQLARLRDAGASVAVLAELTDVDDAASARAVAEAAPGTRFAQVLRRLDSGVAA